MNFPTPPQNDPIELARESARKEREEKRSQQQQHVEAPATAPEPRQSSPKRQRESSVNIDVSDIIGRRQKRFTRTFTLSVEADDMLSEASEMLQTPRSTVLEKAFMAWWPVVKKSIEEK